MKKIILTGGGTAGHCTPNVALIPYLKNHFDKIYYLGSKNGIERSIIEKENIEYYAIDCAKLNRKLTIDNLKIPFKLINGIRQATKLIETLKPNVIFSKGGYVSLPTVIAGFIKKIPVISHESDLTIGLANKISGFTCKKILTSFPETANQLKNGIYVGPPLKKSLYSVNPLNAFKYFGLDSNKTVLLVTGGSQGSKIINETLQLALPHLTQKFHVLHICGKNNYKPINIKGYYQYEFIEKMEYAYAITSICITRAGSNTLFELLSQKIPCLVIPLPKGASRGDQILNAQYFYKKNAINLLLQDNLTTNSLIKKTIETYENKELYYRSMDKLDIKDACPKIAEIILNYVK